MDQLKKAFENSGYYFEKLVVIVQSDSAQIVQTLETLFSKIKEPDEPPSDINAESREEDLVHELMPIFKSAKDEVLSFLDMVRNAEPRKITFVVNGLVKNHVILADLRKKALWSILHEYGIYNKTFQNWNEQIE